MDHLDFNTHTTAYLNLLFSFESRLYSMYTYCMWNLFESTFLASISIHLTPRMYLFFINLLLKGYFVVAQLIFQLPGIGPELLYYFLGLAIQWCNILMESKRVIVLHSLNDMPNRKSLKRTSFQRDWLKSKYN